MPTTKRNRLRYITKASNSERILCVVNIGPRCWGQVAEAQLVNVHVGGSLLVKAECVMGHMEDRHADDGNIVEVHHPDGRNTW